MNGDKQPTRDINSAPRVPPPIIQPTTASSPIDSTRGDTSFVASIDRHLLFEQLSADDLAQMDAVSSVKVVAEGETIYQTGAPASHIYVNLEGAVYLLLAGHPTDQLPILSEVLAGEIFGVSSVVGNKRYTTDAVAAQQCRVLSIESKTFLGLLRNNPQAGMRFAQGVARVYMDRYLDLMRYF